VSVFIELWRTRWKSSQPYPRVALRDVGWMNVRDLHDAYVREVERNSEREWGIDPNEANTTPTTQGDN
jgi:hypothetical protein